MRDDLTLEHETLGIAACAASLGGPELARRQVQVKSTILGTIFLIVDPLTPSMIQRSHGQVSVVMVELEHVPVRLLPSVNYKVPVSLYSTVYYRVPVRRL